MVSVEAFDELLAVNILLVARAAVPKMRMPVADEYLFTVRSPVHGDFSYPVMRAILAASKARSSGQPPSERGPALAPAHEQRSVFDIDQRFIHVAETNDRIVVNHDHAAIMR